MIRIQLDFAFLTALTCYSNFHECCYYITELYTYRNLISPNSVDISALVESYININLHYMRIAFGLLQIFIV